MKENNVYRKITQKWLDFAIEDYELVVYLSDKNKRFNRSICFHAQQFVEKILKGVLDGEGILPPRIHDINALIKRVEKLNIKVPLTENQTLFLSSIYIDTRYPPDVGLLPGGEPLQTDVEIAIKAVKKIKKWID
ncbi:HEPN domain-containing protein [bacterium]|nr:HEPN domain-containing protein [bacterium]